MQALQDRQDAPAVERVSRTTRLRSRLAHRVAVIAAGVVGIIAGGTSGAFAVGSSTDLTGGAGDTFFTKITSYFTGHVLVSVLALLALTVGVSMLIGWGRKAAKSK